MKKQAPPVFRILAADDDESVLESYRRVLTVEDGQEGWEEEYEELRERLLGPSPEQDRPAVFDLTLCRQGDEAVAAVQRAVNEGRPYAVAFLDVRMPPGPDGVQTAQKIRALAPDVEIVIVTAYSDVHPSVIARSTPPVDKLLFLQKPFHYMEIQSFASSLTAKWQAENRLKNARKELEDRVQRRTAELSRANEKLEKDLHRRKIVEAALRESEERFISLLYTLKDVVWAAPPDMSRLLYINPAAREVLGIPPDRLAREPRLWIEAVHPDDRKRLRKAHARLDETVRFDLEYRIIKPGGRVRWVREKRTLVADENGHTVRIGGIITDVTRPREAEEDLRRKEEDLTVKTRELAETNTALTVMLDRRERERQENGQKLKQSLDRLVLPYLDRMRRRLKDQDDQTLLDIILSNLTEVASPRDDGLKNLETILTPGEMEIADMLRRGLPNKEIASFLDVSPATVAFHRSNIRQKLGLKNKKVNLRAYLRAHA